MQSPTRRRRWAMSICLCLVIASSTYAAATYTLTDLGILSGCGDSSSVGGINSFGQVVGYSSSSNCQRPFLWSPTSANATSGSMVAIGGLPAGDHMGAALGINDFGQVVGQGFVPYAGWKPFLWTPSTPNGVSGSTSDLGGSGPVSGADAI